MSAKIARIYSDDHGPMLVVPGTNPEQILRDAAGELDTGEKIYTPLEDVKVRWWRISPCHENSCWDGGGHRVHYEDWHGKTRGSFQAAGLVVGYVDSDAPESAPVAPAPAPADTEVPGGATEAQEG